MESLDKIQSDHVLLWSLSLAISPGTGRGTSGDDEWSISWELNVSMLTLFLGDFDS
jgi:hypothetical protein